MRPVPTSARRSRWGAEGEQLHDWMFEGRSPAEIEQFEIDHFRDIGAVIVGRRMADLGIGPWGEEPTFHAPVFVVTNRPRRHRIGAARRRSVS
jgi:dihydrofolate reductase